MNRSGEALAGFEQTTGESPVAQESLILTDDIYLPVGTLRIRPGGSTGGHRGLESVEEYFGTADYPRLRIGVGRGSADELVDHVLSGFEEEERVSLQESLERAEEASEVWIREGIESAMNRFNRRSKEEDS
jgi:PTH1 family peptidyl-tRNA hydrolase